MTVVTFWYRRINEIAALLSLLILIAWLLATFVTSSALLLPLTVSDPAAIASLVALVTATVSLTLGPRARTTWVPAVNIAALAFAVLLSIESTGNLSSLYIPLWVIVALLGAVGGYWSFIPVGGGLIAYGLYLTLQGAMGGSDWINYGLVMALPVLIGFILWFKRFQAQDTSSQAMSRLARQLSTESNKSEIIINAIADGVILIDTDGVVQLINPAAEQIVGWGKEDATQLNYQSVLKLINAKDELVEGELDPVQQCLNTNKSVLTDTLGIRTASGKRLLASILVSPISETGSGVIVVFRDITAQRAEERGKAEFISTASHEMRTPVAAIEGYLGLALNPQTATIDDKARMYLAKAHESAQHLGELFQDLLDVSKAEDGRLNNKPTLINVIDYVRTTLDDFEGQVREKGLSLVYTPDATATGSQKVSPIYYSKVDPVHFKEIVSNLVSNAIKYTKEGTVSVNVKADDDHVYVSVKDSGIGIPAEDLPHLFQKFYRVDNTDTREIGGTGLGLYLSRRLAESMEGHLNVDSAYGEGSTFTLDIPRIDKETAAKLQDEAKKEAETKPAAASQVAMPIATQMPVQPVAAPNPAPTATPVTPLPQAAPSPVVLPPSPVAHQPVPTTTASPVPQAVQTPPVSPPVTQPVVSQTTQPAQTAPQQPAAAPTTQQAPTPPAVAALPSQPVPSQAQPAQIQPIQPQPAPIATPPQPAQSAPVAPAQTPQQPAPVATQADPSVHKTT